MLRKLAYAKGKPLPWEYWSQKLSL